MATKPLTADEMTEAFGSLPLKEQNDLIASLVSIRDNAVEARRQELLAELQSLGGISEPPKAKRTVTASDGRSAPKVTHRGPNGEEWRSRGVKPKWLTDLIAKGHDAEEFRVKE